MLDKKEEVIEGLKKVWDAFDHMEHELYADYVFDALEMLMQSEPVRHGHWIEKEGFDGDTYFDCSACGYSWVTIEGTPQDNEMNYCPYCGAHMDEVSE